MEDSNLHILELSSYAQPEIIEDSKNEFLAILMQKPYQNRIMKAMDSFIETLETTHDYRALFMNPNDIHFMDKNIITSKILYFKPMSTLELATCTFFFENGKVKIVDIDEPEMQEKIQMNENGIQIPKNILEKAGATNA